MEIIKLWCSFWGHFFFWLDCTPIIALVIVGAVLGLALGIVAMVGVGLGYVFLLPLFVLNSQLKAAKYMKKEILSSKEFKEFYEKTYKRIHGDEMVELSEDEQNEAKAVAKAAIEEYKKEQAKECAKRNFQDNTEEFLRLGKLNKPFFFLPFFVAALPIKLFAHYCGEKGYIRPIPLVILSWMIPALSLYVFGSGYPNASFAIIFSAFVIIPLAYIYRANWRDRYDMDISNGFGDYFVSRLR